MMELSEFNSLPASEAEAQLMRCCGAARWARAMTQGRPFGSIEEIEQRADSEWLSLGREDWLEAFSHHPRIGEQSLREKFSATREWSGNEQSGVQEASDATLKALLEGNRAYERRFGHIFLVCATGKSADEMLAMLEVRLGNTPDAELKVAVAEHAKITRIRIRKLIEK